MTEVHNYDTEKVPGSQLTGRDVLVGESGGLSAIYDVRESSAMPGLLSVETEHGMLYLDPDERYQVLRRF
jgi:hypothetical protein